MATISGCGSQTETIISQKTLYEDTNQTTNSPNNQYAVNNSTETMDIGAILFGDFSSKQPCNHESCDFHKMELSLQVNGQVIKTVSDFYNGNANILYTKHGRYSQDKQIINVRYDDNTQDKFILNGNELNWVNQTNNQSTILIQN